MARRARTLWRELEAESGAELLTECGVSWFAHREDGWEAESERVLGELGIPTERWSVEEAATRFPSFDGDDLAWVLHEPEAGVLRAQQAVQTLARQARGARARRSSARRRDAGRRRGRARRRPRARGRPDRVELRRLAARSSSRELVTLRVTRQELFFFDGGPAWRDAPGWVDYDRAIYGTGDLDALGVKVAWDQEGPAAGPRRRAPAPRPPRPRRSRAATSPTASPRSPQRAADGLEVAAATSSRPTATSSPRRTRSTPRVWIVGGGSGHGFKHGPAMAERIATAWDGGAAPAHFALGGAPRRRAQERGLEPDGDEPRPVGSLAADLRAATVVTGARAMPLASSSLPCLMPHSSSTSTARSSTPSTRTSSRGRRRCRRAAWPSTAGASTARSA